MRARRLAAAALLWLAAGGPGAAEPADLLGRNEATLHTFRERYGFPGATAAIVLLDGTVATAATGLADVEAGRPMTPETRMLAASIGKTFVGATVLALESDGRLARTDRLAAHLGDRPWAAVLPNADSITIDHLLQHHSGLSDLPEFHAAAATRIASGASAFAPEEVLAFLTGGEPLFEAGTGWAYTDTGYILLGLVIEEVTGRSYYDEVRERLLDPLDPADTVPSDRPGIAGLAVGYTVPGNAFGLPERTADADGRLVWDPGVEWTGGRLASTSQDLPRWCHALFGGGAMEAPYLDLLLDGVPVAPRVPSILFGAGVAVHADTPRGPVYGHGGWIPAYVSSLRHDADHGITVAFQINSDAGVVDDNSDLVPTLEAALADLSIEAAQ